MTGESEQPSLVYHSSLGDDCELDESGAYKCYLERLSANTAREEAAGATLYGSHKDDIIIRLDGRDARLYASQGQQRSLALSMKLGEGQISRSETETSRYICSTTCSPSSTRAASSSYYRSCEAK